MSRVQLIGIFAALAVGCASSASNSERRIIASWPVDPSAGITTVSTTYAPDIKIGTTRVVSSQQELRKAWEFFGFRGKAPTFPFETRQVIVFVEGGLCSGRSGDRGGLPVLGAWLVEGGGVIPIFDEVEQVACEEGHGGPRTGVAYAIAIPRVVTDGPLHVVTGVHPKPDTRPDLSGQAPRNFENESSALPQPGNAVLVARGDGSPVWVVRHRDGSSSALGAEYEPLPDSLPGFHAVARYSEHRFLGPFDEWGTHLSGRRPGLMRYELRVHDDELEIGEALGRVPPGRPRVPPPSLTPSQASAAPFANVPRRGVADALKQPQGALSVVRGHVRLIPNQPALLCEGDASSARDCTTVSDLRAASDCSGVMSGDFALQRDGAALAHLVAVSPGEILYSCRRSDGERVEGGNGGSWGLTPLTFAFNGGAYAGLRSNEPQIGADAGAALRWRHRRSYVEGFWKRQFGDTFELSLHARWFDELGRHADPSWAFGLSPSLIERSVLSSWATPTLLGVALPEIGVITQRHEQNAYLAWQFPIEYRPYPRRQRPYTLSERLAWNITPQFLVALGDTSERWHAGVSTGFVVW